MSAVPVFGLDIVHMLLCTAVHCFMQDILSTGCCANKRAWEHAAVAPACACRQNCCDLAAGGPLRTADNFPFLSRNRLLCGCSK